MNTQRVRFISARIELDEACRGASLPRVVFDGHVEDGAMMLLALGDPSLDYFGAFEDASQADVQVASLALGHDEIYSSRDTHARWKARYSVDVTLVGMTGAPGMADVG